MKKTLYVKLTESPETGYCYINNMQKEVKRNEKELKEEYERTWKIIKSIPKENRKRKFRKKPSFEKFKKKYIRVKVTFDGRKRRIFEEDIMKSLEEDGIVKKIGKGGFFGGHYKKRRTKI